MYGYAYACICVQKQIVSVFMLCLVDISSSTNTAVNFISSVSKCLVLEINLYRLINSRILFSLIIDLDISLMLTFSRLGPLRFLCRSRFDCALTRLSSYFFILLSHSLPAMHFTFLFHLCSQTELISFPPTFVTTKQSAYQKNTLMQYTCTCTVSLKILNDKIMTCWNHHHHQQQNSPGSRELHLLRISVLYWYLLNVQKFQHQHHHHPRIIEPLENRWTQKKNQTI